MTGVAFGTFWCREAQAVRRSAKVSVRMPGNVRDLMKRLL
jgi:hypothetical protein